MLEMGPDLAAQKLVEMDLAFVAMAFSRHLWVLDLDDLKAQYAAADPDDERLINKVLESRLSFEFDNYLAVSRDDASWDALLAILSELDSRHRDVFERLLKQLYRLASESMEAGGGLYRMLTASEQLEADAAEVREERRVESRFITPVLAAQFLDQSPLSDTADELLELRWIR